jgi:hypothetical protein
MTKKKGMPRWIRIGEASSVKDYIIMKFGQGMSPNDIIKALVELGYPYINARRQVRNIMGILHREAKQEMTQP